MTVSRRNRFLTALGSTTLSAAVLIGGSSLSPVFAAPGGHISTDQSITFPSASDISAAKDNEAAKKRLIAQLEGNVGALSDQQDAAVNNSMRANDAYGTALLTLKARQEAASAAKARLSAAQASEKSSRKTLGTLASSIYQNGGISPSVQSVLNGDPGDVLNRATTLDTLAQKENATLNQALAASKVSSTLAAEAKAAQDAADAAAKAASDSHAAAQSAQDAVSAALKTAADDRARAVADLASLRGTTVALETARVQGLEEQRQQERLAELQAKAAQILAQQQAEQAQQAAQGGQGSQGDGSGSQGGSGDGSGGNPGTDPFQPPVVNPPVVNPPVVNPPVVNPPVVNPPVVNPPVVNPPVVNPPVVTPPPVKPPVVTPPVVTPPVTPPNASVAQTAINFAMSKVGGPYVWGGNGPVGYDCSGLTTAAFASAGVGMPRTATPQYFAAPVKVPMSQWQPGDLIFFGDGSYFYHVAIYLGNGKVVQALNYQDGITVTPLSWMGGMQLWPIAGRYS